MATDVADENDEGRTCALLVIDVQVGLFDPEPHPFEAAEVVGRINRVTAWARTCGYPVIFVQHETAAADSPLAHRSPGWQLQAGLETAPEDFSVRKSTPDSFLRTGLQEKLDELKITQLIVCGYATEFCVDTTVRRAAGLGYPVTLVADAHTTHDKPHASGAAIRTHHNCTLPNISSFGVRIRSIGTEELISDVSGYAA